MTSTDKTICFVASCIFLAFETVVICVTIYNLVGCR